MVYDHLLTAIQAAIEAGREILAVYDDPASDFQIERKADQSPLTIADRRAHAVIAARLAGTPYPLLSEEGRHQPFAERSQWPCLWVVDPLDGTKEFIKRNGEFTVNIALIRRGVPVMGVIYVPVKRTLYFAHEDLGAYRLDTVSGHGCERSDSGQPDAAPCPPLAELIARSTRLPEPRERSRYVVVASRSHLSPETQDYIDSLASEHPEGVVTISSGSSIKICLVAEGRADLYPRFAPTMEWDTAAGHAIARAAGCEVYQADTGQPLIYNKVDLHNPWFIVRPRQA